MPITLRIVSPKPLPPELLNEISFDTKEGHIGRGGPPDYENDWLLLNDRGVSKKHATIVFENNSYYLVDHSANGTGLQYKGQDKRRIHQQKEPLADGDKLLIGQYEIEVSIDTHTQTTIPHSDVQCLPELFEELSPNDESVVPGPLILNDLDLEQLPEGSLHQSVSLEPPTPPIISSDENRAENSLNSHALQAFLEGIGLSKDELTVAQLDPDLMKSLGTALRKTVEGLIELLKGRAEFKHVYEAFEEDYTVFGPERNNPLKHISLAQMALKTMLSRERGFLPVDQAIEEAMIDIKIHQSALIYSIRKGLNKTLQHFDPKKIEKLTSPRSNLSALLTSKKSQHWDEFVKRYHQQNVNELLRQELVNGYLDYTKRLKKPLSKKKT